ncbi:hypothetical protein ACCO45_013340 [Purpureocillium lilacinum]|uniref:Uncharacterized protein n=1 Tax=Purpureocillium lilacinum TaxID=33203 RepID=A0ACC4DB66_PURLI
MRSVNSRLLSRENRGFALPDLPTVTPSQISDPPATAAGSTTAARHARCYTGAGPRRPATHRRWLALGRRARRQGHHRRSSCRRLLPRPALLDRVVPPSSRRHAYDAASALASSRPMLFSFLVVQVCFSFLPLILFALFCASAAGFALAAGLLFTLFWMGVALFILVPTLLLTSSVAALVWAWALAAFVVARFLYSHAPAVVSGVQAQAPGKRVDVKGKTTSVARWRLCTNRLGGFHDS